MKVGDVVQLDVGERVTLVSLLGHGACGRVFKCQYDDGSVAALKVFDPDRRCSPTEAEKLRRRFRREVSLQSMLSPALVMPVLHRGLDHDPPFFVMPLAGETFEEFIKRTRADRMPISVYSQALAAVLEALQEMHRLSYVHRDLKPSNILYHDGRWKVADLGFARVDTARMTSTASHAGTFAYVSPEQFTQFHEAGPATDIYAFGCILHDVLEGPEKRVPLHQQCPSGPLGLVVSKCTEDDPADRFNSVEHLRAVLLDLLISAGQGVLDPAATDWVARLDGVDVWTSEDLTAFLGFLRRLDVKSSEYDQLMRRLDETSLDIYESIDDGRYAAVAHTYCKWAARSAFQFDYCDIVAQRLQHIFDSSRDAGMAARAVLAAAKMGASHNRWRVWSQVVSMCGPGLSNDIAERIAIDIRLDECYLDFVVCASRSSLAQYHPAILAQLRACE